MTEIKDCKKCGGEGQLYCGLDDMYEVWCEELNCDNRTENGYRSDERAIKEWNDKV